MKKITKEQVVEWLHEYSSIEDAGCELPECNEVNDLCYEILTALERNFDVDYSGDDK